MAKLAPYLLRAYMTFRDPKFFLIVLILYIVGALLAHTQLNWDPEFGLTNLLLSIEASTASAVLMMVAERTAATQDEMAKLQREQMAQLLRLAESNAALMQTHVAMLKEIRDNDRALLEYLKSLK